MRVIFPSSFHQWQLNRPARPVHIAFGITFAGLENFPMSEFATLGNYLSQRPGADCTIAVEGSRYINHFSIRVKAIDMGISVFGI